MEPGCLLFLTSAESMLGISSAPGKMNRTSSCYPIHNTIGHKHSPTLGTGSRSSVFLTSIGSSMRRILSSAPGERSRSSHCHGTLSSPYIGHIYSLALGVEPCFPVFLHGREARTLLMILGTMVVTKSGVSSGGWLV